MSNPTTKTYQNPLGAERFWEKEQKPAAERNASVWQFMDRLNLKGQVVLDVGCGFGRDVGELRRRGAEAYGIDVSPGLLSIATKDYGPYFAEADFFNSPALPFNLTKLDMVWSVAMFVHVPPKEINLILKQWDSWLNVGGQIVILTKHGEGQATYHNLGEDLPREMYFHRPEIFTGALPQYQIKHQAIWQPTVVADEFMGLILEKTA